MSKTFRASLVTMAPLSPGYLQTLALLLLSLFLFLSVPAPTLAAAAQTQSYTVVSGNTLYQIALKYKTTVDTLLGLNNLTSTDLKVGQVIIVPVVTDPSTAVYYHIVKSGDTLYLIAQHFGTTVNDLTTANHLTSTTLTVNQALLLPASSLYIEYMVQPGNTLASISTAFSTTVDKIKTLSVLTSNTIYVGQTLLVPRKITPVPTPTPTPAPVPQLPSASIVGFYTDSGGTYSYTTGMSWVSPFWYQINQKDATNIQNGGNLTDADVQKLVSAAHTNHLKVIPVIYNFLYTDSSLNQSLVTQMLSSTDNMNKFIANTIALLQKYGYDGVNIDFEGIKASDRSGFSTLCQQLGSQLHAKGYILSVDVPAKASDSLINAWSAAYDYSALGQAVDKVMLMMYNEHGYPGSGAGPVSSISFNQTVVKYAITQISPQKIILDEPVFGFDFNLTTGVYTMVSYSAAIQTAQNYKVTPVFDTVSQTPYFSYTDASNSQKHQVWFEDADSLKPKLDLTTKDNLAGIGLWHLGMEDPQIWTVIPQKVKVN